MLSSVSAKRPCVALVKADITVMFEQYEHGLQDQLGPLKIRSLNRWAQRWRAVSPLQYDSKTVIVARFFLPLTEETHEKLWSAFESLSMFELSTSQI